MFNSETNVLPLVEPKIEKIEWNRNVILDFIEDYKQHRLLWDPAIKDYHVKSIKYAALEELSKKYSIEVRTVRGKIKSLRSSFHREHGKVRLNEEKGIAYRPMWFAYEPMKFILEAAEYSYEVDSQYNNCGSINNTERCFDYKSNFKRQKFNSDVTTASCSELFNHFRQILPEDIKTELIEDDASSVYEDQSSIENNNNNEEKPIKTRKRHYSAGFITQPQQLMKFTKDFEHSSHNVRTTKANSNQSQSTSKPLNHNTTNKQLENFNVSDLASPTQRDEYSVFGEYVGMTIRHLNNDTAKIVCKHYINNLLFEAEMGKYDNGILATKTPPNLYQTSDDNF